MNECENVRRSYSSIVGISSEVLRVLLGVFLPLRALVIHQVLQAVPAIVIGGVKARAVVPRAPVLVQVLENEQVPISGCVPARVRVPRASVLVQVLESGQVPINSCVSARACTPNKTVVLSRPLQQSYTPPGSSVVTYVLRSFTKKSDDSLVGQRQSFVVVHHVFDEITPLPRILGRERVEVEPCLLYTSPSPRD